MKIVLHSFEELLQLARLVTPGADLTAASIAADPRDGRTEPAASPAPRVGSADGLPASDSYAEAAESVYGATVPAAEAAPKEPTASPDPEEPAARDASGLPWDERIHAGTRALNKDGTWRTKRNVDPTLLQAVEAELRAGLAEATDASDPGEVEASSEPVATETHALPSIAPDSASADAAELGAVDLADVVAGARGVAGDASDSLQELLLAAKDFIGAYGTQAFTDLKAAVAPVESSDGAAPLGKAIPQLSPTERRLLRASLEQYPLHV